MLANTWENKQPGGGITTVNSNYRNLFTTYSNLVVCWSYYDVGTKYSACMCDTTAVSKEQPTISQPAMTWSSNWALVNSYTRLHTHVRHSAIAFVDARACHDVLLPLLSTCGLCYSNQLEREGSRALIVSAQIYPPKASLTYIFLPLCSCHLLL